MNLEVLEARDTPAAVDAGDAGDAGGGLVGFDTGASVSAFGPTWTGELNVVTDDAGGRVYVGGGPGAGPNLATFDLSGNRVTPDVYVGGHPESREGLVPVLVGGQSPTRFPTSFGPPDGYTVFLDDESGRPPAVVAQLARGVEDALAPAGNVRVVTTRPDADPTTFATVVIGAPLDWFGAPVVGLAEVGGVDNAPVGLRSPTAYVAGFSPAVAPVRVVAHEIGHLFGLGHSTDTRDAMYPEDLPGPTVFLGNESQVIRDAAAAALARDAARGAEGMMP